MTREIFSVFIRVHRQPEAEKTDLSGLQDGDLRPVQATGENSDERARTGIEI